MPECQSKNWDASTVVSRLVLASAFREAEFASRGPKWGTEHHLTATDRQLHQWLSVSLQHGRQCIAFFYLTVAGSVSLLSCAQVWATLSLPSLLPRKTNWGLRSSLEVCP